MTTASIECPRCGTPSMVPVDALLVTVAVDEDDAQLAGYASWLCASCTDLVASPVGWPSLLTLITEGAALLEEDSDDPLPPHPESPVNGPTLTRDDLLELHELLASETWFDALTAARCTNP